LRVEDKDDWAPATRCRALQQAGFRHPDLVGIIYYPNAHHGFDVNEPPLSVSGARLFDGTVNGAVQHHIEFDLIAALTPNRGLGHCSKHC